MKGLTMINVDLDKCKSTQIIELICDYCGVKFSRKKHHVLFLRRVIPKDSCGSKECTVTKRAESTKAVHGEGCFKGKLLEKAKSSNLEKYGVENTSKLESVKEKTKKTNLQKYGKSSYLATDECRLQGSKKSMELYGVDHFSKAEEMKAKSKETSIERHGDLFQKTKRWKDKVKKTCVERYGVEYVSMVDEFKAKKEKTMMERYGGKSPLSDERVKERAKTTLKENYGVDSALQSPIIMARMKKTCKERYGSEHAMANDEIKTKSIQARLDKYGTLISKFGKKQSEITSWINSKGFDFRPDVLILEGKELDLYDPRQQLALEYCGLYWHNENSPQPRTRSYHYDKWRMCRAKGIQLLTIFDDEWNYKTEIIKSVILSKLGVFERRVYARKCKVHLISKNQMKSFCDLHHIQGGNKLSNACFGLFHEEELVGVVDLGRHHRKKRKDSVVLTRLCFKAGLQVVGGAGKLFGACVDWCSNNGIRSVVSWSDNRYSDGTVYKKLNFRKIAELPPDYYYVNMKSSKRRLSKQSQSKRNSECPKEMTELEWANSRGLSRIWDCGKIRWECEIPQNTHAGTS